MKRTLKICIALLMAVVMTMNLPLGAYAATKEQTYISEVKIGYGEAGKKALKDAGYIVRDDMNMNSGGVGGDVWLGYKTTLNKNEAITDMALMNQGGGYDFQGWCDELDEIQTEISIMLDRFEAAIKEYQANLKAGSPYAELAKKILNIYIDDDDEPSTTDETGLLLGDLFEKYGVTPAEGETAVTKDNLVTLFMQGNVDSLGTVKSLLALACTEYSEDCTGQTFIDRLAEYECIFETEEDVKNSDRSAVLYAIENAREDVLYFEKMKADAIKLYGSEEAYLETLSDSKKLEYLNLLVFYETAKNTAYTSNYADGEFTLLDLIKLPEEYVDDDTPCLDDFLLDPLVKCLTPGQLGAIDVVGLSLLLTMAAVASSKESSEAMLKEKDEMYTNLVQKTNGGTTSIYDGVDRELFYDRETIALTSDAIRAKAQEEGGGLGKKTVRYREVNEALRNTAIGVFAFGCVCIGLAAASFVHQAYSLSLGVISKSSNIGFGWYLNDLSWFAEGGTYGFGSFGGSIAVGTFRTVMTTLGIIAMIAALTLLIITLVDYFEQPEEEEVITFTYSKIPRVLMDLQYKGVGKKEKYYMAYYAAENITPVDITRTIMGLETENSKWIKDLKPGSEDSLSKYGDLNGLCNECAWLTLYTTKDAKAGTPLLADLKISTSSTPDEGYKGVHMFGDTNAVNLNQLQLNGAGKVYLFMQHSVASETQEPSDGTMSVFVKNPSVNAALAMGLFAVGAMVSGFAVAGYYKKKERYTA